ncbi:MULTISPECIES: type IV pilin [Natrialbaceae]|uniref:type IV pilin n=1 Tax=Natrialbaceae TaxID=1644061 RepID=UPI00207D5250|nr:type IV pilin N-terminal domain-containing protein [Natronococcus sp. CG52]
MDGKTIVRKLVGNDEERAVSPVIGVILMVAITVILAAVIAAFVLDMGDSIEGEAQAGATIEVENNSNTQQVQVSVTSMGNAEEIELGGDYTGSATLTESGDVVTFTWELDDTNTENGFDSNGDGNGDNNDWDFSAIDPGDHQQGTLTVIAVTNDDTETVVASEEFEFGGYDAYN